MDGAVLGHLVPGAHAVLDDHDGDLVAVPDLVEREAQSVGVDLPAPVGGLKVGVLAAEGHVAGGLLDAVGAHDVAHVVAEGVEVDGPLLEVVEVPRPDVKLDAVVAPEAPGVGGVVAANLDVGTVPVHLAHLLLVEQDVGGIAGGGVGQDEAVHVAHPERGVALVRVADGAARGHELVVKGLIAVLEGGMDAGRGTLVALDHAGLEEVAHVHGAAVDLVEGEPVGDLAMIAVEDGLGIPLEEADELAGGPAVVLLDEVVGHLVMGHGHQGLDAMGVAAVEDPVVEGETGLVGLGVVAVGEDAAPADGHAEHVEAHLREQRDVLLVAVVEVDAVMVGIELVGIDLEGDLARPLVGAAREVVVDGRTAAVCVPGTLELVGGRGPAPEEALGENCCHDGIPSRGLVGLLGASMSHAPALR